MDAQTIGVGIAAVSAFASAVSAYTSRLAVDRANQAFVWPSISHGREQGRDVLRVRLHNDGSGVAYDVRWSVGTVREARPDKWVSDDEHSARYASQVIRALRPGESIPPLDSQWLERVVDLPEDDVWWLSVRWTDAARVRWELSEQGPSLLRLEPRRLRTWRWQVWRDKRDW